MTGVYSLQIDGVEYFPPKAASLILEKLSLSKAPGEDFTTNFPKHTTKINYLVS